MKKNIKTTRGFTLVEAIVSVLLFSIVMVVFSTLLSTGLGIHKKALDTTKKSIEGASNISTLDLDNIDTSQITTQPGQMKIEGLSEPIDGIYYIEEGVKSQFQYFKPSVKSE